MKKILAIAFMLLVAAGAYAQEGKRIYTRYSDSEGVSAVYISPSMFKIIGKLPEMEVEVGDGETMDIAPLVRSFSGFYLLDIEDNSLASELRTEVNSMIGKGRYEMLMEMKDSGTTVRIYTAGDEKTIESFIFLASEGDEAQFICLEGSMNRKDVEELIAKAAAQ
jgi:hypothetical protein